ncbi:MAG: RHS repeat-associated core domain-containing protein [Actinomycetota bacterium]
MTKTDQTSYAFDDKGRLHSVKDRHGEGLNYEYSGNDVSAITDSAGRTVTLSYSQGLISRLSLEDGRFVEFSYDSQSKQLTSVKDLAGGLTRYAYDANGRISQIIDQNGHVVVDNEYDDAGRVLTQTDGRGKVSTFSFDDETGRTTFTDPKGTSWTDSYTGNVLESQEDPLGNTWSYGHNARLDRTSITDPLGNTTTLVFDADHNLTRRTSPAPLSYVEEWSYNTRNDVTSYVDGRGNETTYEYDAQGNLTEINRPMSATTRFTYDPRGLVTSETDPRGKTTSYDYDSDGNLVEIETPRGNATTMVYDSSGRLTERVEARGNEPGADPADFTWSFGYDDADRLITVTDPLGNETSFSHDLAGNLLSVRDANMKTTSYEYDEANNLSLVTAPDLTTAAYTYDDASNLETRTDANSHLTTYGYDEANRLSSITSPIGQLWTYSFDEAGNIEQMTDANGNATPGDLTDGITDYSYDEMNRLVAMDYADATPDVAFEFDENSNRTEMADGAGTETYTYDALNRLQTVMRGPDVFSYNYDQASNVTERVYPDGTTIDYAYNDDEQLETVTTGAKVTTYSYDAAGNIEETELPNGAIEERSYDNAGRLVEIGSESAGDQISSFDYTLDAVGNPLRVDSPDETITYDYDELYRLTEACYQISCPAPSDPFIRYSYDDVGNRLTEERPEGTTTYSYNGADQLTSLAGPLTGSDDFAYDHNGNLVTLNDPGTGPPEERMTYDQANNNRLTEFRVGLQRVVATYSYDGDGKRLEEVVDIGLLPGPGGGNPPPRSFGLAWDPNHPLPMIAQEDTEGGNPRRHIYGHDLIFSEEDGERDFYYHYDAIGSVVNTTDQSGELMWSYGYEPFGEGRFAEAFRENPEADPLPPSTLMGFTGEYADPASGFYHLRAREYDPGTGRFLQPDPVEEGVFSPAEAGYVYASNRPTVLVDPSGRIAEPVCGPVQAASRAPESSHSIVDRVTGLDQADCARLFEACKGICNDAYDQCMQTQPSARKCVDTYNVCVGNCEAELQHCVDDSRTPITPFVTRV